MRRGNHADALQAAELFADWFAALSEATRRNYAQDLGAFAAHLGVHDRRQAAVALCTATPLDARSLVLRFKTARRDAGEAPGTINRRLSALRSLYRHVTGVPLVIPSIKAVPRRRVHRGPGSLVASLLATAATAHGIKALRDVALVATLHDSGLRRAEAASLRVRDLDLEARVAHVIAKGRMGEREAVDLSAPAVDALKAYLTARGALLPDSPVFSSCDRARKGNGALTADGIHSILSALSERAGFTQRIAPHDLRRCGARSLAKAGADAETLRRWGRWADYRTPARYVGEVAEKGREAVDLLARLRQAAG
ncbi:MAG: tyrosine-type recombinase/integrase [Planctomycetes bacterium]|nr:tyrosine-type recombinase/integrase [Planctomycetota bacterium]